MQVNVRSNIADVVKLLESRKRAVLDKAIPRALTRTAEMAATQAGRDIKSEGYAFKAAEVRHAMAILRATQNSLVAGVRVRRHTKNLMEFGARQTKDGVRVKVLGSAKLIKHAFIGQLRNGRLGVYIEDKTKGKTVLRKNKQHGKGSVGGWQSFPVRKLYGPSVGGVYGTEKVQRLVLAFIGRNFPKRLAHEIDFLAR